jgi:hypothetical protein
VVGAAFPEGNAAVTNGLFVITHEGEILRWQRSVDTKYEEAPLPPATGEMTRFELPLDRDWTDRLLLSSRHWRRLRQSPPALSGRWREKVSGRSDVQAECAGGVRARDGRLGAARQTCDTVAASWTSGAPERRLPVPDIDIRSCEHAANDRSTQQLSAQEPLVFCDHRPLPVRRRDDHRGRMCQRWSGGLFLCFAADASAVTVTGEVTRYRSSAFAERAFCPRCGSHLWFNDVQEGGEPQSYELMPGLFDAARSWPLRSEIYVDRAMDSVNLRGDHPRKSRAEYEAENPFVEGDMK